MANFLSKLFGSTKQDSSYTGPRPYGSLLDATGGKDYYNTILARSQGQGVGYGDQYANQMSNPIIQNSRAQFNDYQMPALNSELSATGRRRGSSGFQQVAQAQKEQGNQEGAIFSQLQQQNEAQKRAEQSQAISQLGAFNQGDYSARDVLSNFENANNNQQVAQATQRRNNEATGLQNMVYAGADLASNFMGGQGGVASRIPQQVQYGNTTYSTSQPPVGQQDYYQNLLARGVASTAQKGRV